MSGAVPKRRYSSPLREAGAAQSRARIVGAAAGLFAERGWSATTLREVARVAGVSLETVYAAVGGKLDLLSAALDVAIVGDAQPVALAARAEFQALGKGTRAQRFAAVGTLMRAVYERSAGMNLALLEAALADPDAARLRQDRLANQRQDVISGMRLVLRREPSEVEIDETWALISFDTYRFLTHGAGWSGEQYAHWLASALNRLHAPGRR